MIAWDDFENAVCNTLGRDISRSGNPDQRDAVSSPPNQSLLIVAGPGSGKTTAISLRVLKLIFVDDIDPSSILVTTFTKKAASELRSRILGWGDQLREVFASNHSYSHVSDILRNLNLNRVMTGTLDSISEQTLRDYRAPGVPPPTVVEDFVSNALMIRIGLFNRGRHNSHRLRNYIISLRGTAFGLNVSEMSATLRELKDRFFHDQVDVAHYRNNPSHPGVPVACDAIEDYLQELHNDSLYDFARLEQEFLEQLRTGILNNFVNNLRFVLVDEYQDTNLLQEQIYFELAREALQNGGSIATVGDDDQSLYRFRGATVDLFQSFLARIHGQLGVTPRLVYLSQNYRSTQTLVDFCNRFILLDRQFQNSRVAGKPSIASSRSQPIVEYPILGMFRSDAGTLAHDLAEFIHRAVHGGGAQVQTGSNRYLVRINPNGSPADIALLLSSPRELNSQGEPRLPLLLRHELSHLTPSIQIFNPRGQSLEEVNPVRILCGFVLECMDPNATVQNAIQRLPHYVGDIFDAWRRDARRFASTNPPPSGPPSIGQFVRAWQSRTPIGVQHWDRNVALIDLIYKLVTWIPILQNDIEGIVYLEAITRTIAQSALFSNFKAEMIFDPNNPNLEQTSIKEIIWNVLVPLATGAIEVNEELLETLPNDRINAMSIHQAKGLEFPLVIVDVGSDFRNNHYAQAFKRFPRDGGKTCNMEDELRRHSPLGQPTRSARDRAFDDLIRQFFVAYSRTQDVLLLVGLDSVRDSIPNIATGWERNGTWHWQQSLPNLVHI